MYGSQPPSSQRGICCVPIGTAALIALAFLIGPFFMVARAQDASDYFHQNCVMCHTVGGGRLIGPDLQGVTKLRDRAWLVQFLMDPKAVIDSGDPYAGKLLQEANGVVMPTPPGMTPALASALISYLDSGPGAAQSSPSEPVAVDQPFTPAEVALGKQIFVGQRRLANGGPACVSCHTLSTLGGLAGGRLGPDLTNEIERLGSRRGATAWLSAPPTATMQAVFSKHPLNQDEILPLLAAIDNAGSEAQPETNAATLMFSGFGLGGMLIGLVVLQMAWRGRMRSVRRSVVRPQIRGEQ